jgi:hypothetical protein
MPRLNSFKWSVLPLLVGFGSLLCNRRKDTTKFRKLAIFCEKISTVPPNPPFSNYQVHDQSKKGSNDAVLVQVCSEFIRIDL